MTFAVLTPLGVPFDKRLSPPFVQSSPLSILTNYAKIYMVELSIKNRVYKIQEVWHKLHPTSSRTETFEAINATST
jgi:hypothetical protein